MKMTSLHFPQINELVNDVSPQYVDEVLGEVPDLPQHVDELIMINIRRLNGTFTSMTIDSFRTFALALYQEFQMHKLDPRLLEQEVHAFGYYNIASGQVQEFPCDVVGDTFVGSFGGIIKLTADKQLSLLP